MRGGTGLVGRRSEIARLREVPEDARWLTLWGPAGVGKSSLARHVWPDAVVCSLTGAESVDAVTWALARALDLDPETEPRIAVGRALQSGNRIVLLDGADQAGRALVELLPAWLDQEDPARILLTVRRRLGPDHPSLAARELAIAVEPLSALDAVELWDQRLRSWGLRGDPALAPAIVERLDCLPLAIEWFASQAMLLGEKAAWERLRAYQEGEDPLTAALAPTLSALAEPEREVLLHISPFEGSASMDLLGRLVGDHAPIARLASASLLRLEASPGGSARVRVYRAVTKHMRRVAEDSGRWSTLMRRHAEEVLAACASEREGALLHAELEAIAERFDEEDPRVALAANLELCRFALHDGTAAARAERLAALLARIDPPPAAGWLWHGRLARRLGRFAVARSSLERAVDGGERFAATIERAHVDRQQSRSEEALAGYSAALALAREDGDERAEAIGLGEMGRMLQSMGRFDAARAYHERAVALAHREGMHEREALERSLHARAIHRAGRIREAIPLHEQALARHRALGRARLAAAEEGHLGFCHHEIAAHEEAERRYRASISGLAAVGDVVLECIERILLARLMSDVGRPAEARLELAIAATATRALDLPRLELTRLFVAGLVDLEAGNVEAARSAWNSALELEVAPEIGFETLLAAFAGWLEARSGSEARAQELFARSLASVAEVDCPGPRAAIELLVALALGREWPPIDNALIACSSDVRRVLRVAHVEVSDAAMRVARDGRRLVLADGTVVDLGRRAAPRRLLVALVRARIETPGTVLGYDELIGLGWPGERMRPDAARKRLRTAIWTLRKMGLESALLTRDDGYLFDPLVLIDWSH